MRFTKGIRRLVALGAIAAAMSAVGCYRAPVKPPPGFIYADIQAPLSFLFADTKMGSEAAKASESHNSYFALIHPGLSLAFDSSAVERIARDGGISEVSSADYSYFNVLGVYSTFTVNVRGN